MPLASTAAFMWYPGHMSCVGAVSPTAEALLDNSVRMGAVDLSSSIGQRAALVLGQRIGAVDVCAPVQAAALKSKVRMGAVDKVNELGQGDIEGAVMGSIVEGGLTLREVMRLLLAQTAGNATGLDSATVEFKSVDGSKTRIGGTVASGNRTITLRDAT